MFEVRNLFGTHGKLDAQGIKPLERTMPLDDLRRKRQHLHENTDCILSNMQELSDESTRVANVAHNA